MNYDHSLPRESSKVNRSIFLLTLHSLMPFRRKYRNNIKLITDYHVLFAMGFFFIICLLFPPKNIDSVFFSSGYFRLMSGEYTARLTDWFSFELREKKNTKKEFHQFLFALLNFTAKKALHINRPESNRTQSHHITSHFIDEYVNPHVTATSFSTLTTELFDVVVMLCFFFSKDPHWCHYNTQNWNSFLLHDLKLSVWTRVTTF